MKLPRHSAKALGRKLLIFTCLLVSSSNLSALAQSVNEAPARHINVSGRGVVEVTPDMAIVSLGVSVEAPTAVAALRENSSRMQALIDMLKARGIAAADIKTQNISLNPRYRERRIGASNTPPEIIAYNASNGISVRVRDLARLGEILDAGVAAGGNSINGIRFDVSDPSAAVEQARARAVADARRKAQQLADLTGATLGEVLSIQESGGMVPVYSAARYREFDVGFMEVPVEAGAQSIDVSVQISWLLQ